MSETNLYTLNALGITNYNKCSRCSCGEREYAEINLGEFSDGIFSSLLDNNNTVCNEDKDVACRIEGINALITEYEQKSGRLFKGELCSECGVENFSFDGNYFDCSTYCLCSSSIDLKRYDIYCTCSTPPQSVIAHDSPTYREEQTTMGTMIRFCSPVSSSPRMKININNCSCGEILFACTYDITKVGFYNGKQKGCTNFCNGDIWVSPAFTSEEYRDCGCLVLEGSLYDCDPCVRYVSLSGDILVKYDQSFNYPSKMTMEIGNETAVFEILNPVKCSCFEEETVLEYKIENNFCVPNVEDCTSVSIQITDLLSCIGSKIVAPIDGTKEKYSVGIGSMCVGYINEKIHVGCECDFTMVDYGCVSNCLSFSDGTIHTIPIFYYYSLCNDCKCCVEPYPEECEYMFRSTIGGTYSLSNCTCVLGVCETKSPHFYEYNQYFQGFCGHVHSDLSTLEYIDNATLSICMYKYLYLNSSNEFEICSSISKENYCVWFYGYHQTSGVEMYNWACQIDKDIKKTGEISCFKCSLAQYLFGDEECTSCLEECECTRDFFYNQLISYLNISTVKENRLSQCTSLIPGSVDPVVVDISKTFNWCVCSCEDCSYEDVYSGTIESCFDVFLTKDDGSLYSVICKCSKFIINCTNDIVWPSIDVIAKSGDDVIPFKFDCSYGDYYPSTYFIGKLTHYLDGSTETLSVCRKNTTEVYFYPISRWECNTSGFEWMQWDVLDIKGNTPMSSLLICSCVTAFPYEMMDEESTKNVDDVPQILFDQCSPCGISLLNNNQDGCFVFRSNLQLESPVEYDSTSFPYNLYFLFSHEDFCKVCTMSVDNVDIYLQGRMNSFEKTNLDSGEYIYDISYATTHCFECACWSCMYVAPRLGIQIIDWESGGEEVPQDVLMSIGEVCTLSETEDTSSNCTIIYYRCFTIKDFSVSSFDEKKYVNIKNIKDSQSISDVPVLCTYDDSNIFLPNKKYNISCSIPRESGKVGSLVFSFNNLDEQNVSVEYYNGNEVCCATLNSVVGSGVLNVNNISPEHAVCVHVTPSQNCSFSNYSITANITGEVPSAYRMNINENGSCFGGVYPLSRYTYAESFAVNIPALNINIGEHITAVLREHDKSCTWEIVYRDNNIKSTMIDNGRVVVVLPEIYENGSTVRITRDHYFIGSEAIVTTNSEDVLVDNYTNSLLLKNERILVTSNGIDTGTDEIMLTSYLCGDIKGWTTVLGQNRWSYCTHCSCAIQPDFVVDMNTL